MNFNDKIIYIEHCVNCKSHKWCTNHNEKKYHLFYEMSNSFKF